MTTPSAAKRKEQTADQACVAQNDDTQVVKDLFVVPSHEYLGVEQAQVHPIVMIVLRALLNFNDTLLEPCEPIRRGYYIVFDEGKVCGISPSTGFEEDGVVQPDILDAIVAAPHAADVVWEDFVVEVGSGRIACAGVGVNKHIVRKAKQPILTIGEMPLGVLVGEEHDDVYLIALIRRKRIHKASNGVREERRRGTIDARNSNAEKLVLYLHFCSLLVLVGVDFTLEVFVDLGFADGGESAIEGDTALVEEGRRVIVAVPVAP